MDTPDKWHSAPLLTSGQITFPDLQSVETRLGDDLLANVLQEFLRPKPDCEDFRGLNLTIRLSHRGDSYCNCASQTVRPKQLGSSVW